MNSRIVNDKREIFGIYFEDNGCYLKNRGHVIKPYAEPGQYGDIAFFEVKRSGDVIARVPATQVSVEYIS